MQYICLKRLMLAGKAYAPGDVIPGAAFLDGRARKLESYGYVRKAEVSERQKPTGRPAKPSGKKDVQPIQL